MKAKTIQLEKKTISVMIEMYCCAKHGTKNALCSDCKELLEYANERLDRCKFGGEKPVCSNCPNQCYIDKNKEMILPVMRYSGPRLLFFHPGLALAHILRSFKKH
jgi:hypothetical protein